MRRIVPKNYSRDTVFLMLAKYPTSSKSRHSLGCPACIALHYKLTTAGVNQSSFGYSQLEVHIDVKTVSSGPLTLLGIHTCLHRGIHVNLEKTWELGISFQRAWPQLRADSSDDMNFQVDAVVRICRGFQRNDRTNLGRQQER